MKKYVKLVLLIVLCVFVGINSVSAAGTPKSKKQTSSFKGQIVDTGECIAGNCHDKNDPNYTSHRYKFVPENNSSGEQYDAYCINPALGVATSVTCELLTCKSYPMLTLAAQDYRNDPNEQLKDVLFRTLGMMEFQSNLFTRTGQIGEFKTKKNNIYLTATWHQAAYEGGAVTYPVAGVNQPYILSSYTGTMSKYIQYWVGQPGGGADACANVKEEENVKDAGGLTGTYFKAVSNGAATNPEFTVTAIKPGTTNVEATGVNENGTKTSIQITQKWDGTSLKFKIRSCNTAAKIKIVGVVPGTTATAEESKTPYLCTGSGDEQAYITFMGGIFGDILTANVPCGNTCPEQEETPADKYADPDPSQKVIYDYYDLHAPNLCCLDSGTGEGYAGLGEYELDNLFLAAPNKYLKVSGYTNKCDNSMYKEEDELQGKLLDFINTKTKYSVSVDQAEVDNFCTIYCTEQIEVKYPGPINSASGKYFKIDGSPRVDAEKRCRIRIDYRSLRAEYEKQILGGEIDPDYKEALSDSTTGELESWNKYQNYGSMKEMLDNYQTETITANVTPNKVEYGRMECIDPVQKTAAPGGSTTVYDENPDGECNSSHVETCTGTTPCTFDSFQEIETHYENQPDDCDTTFNVYKLKGQSTDGVKVCNLGLNDKCEIQYWQIDIPDVLSYFPYGKQYKGLELKFKTGTFKNYFNLFTTEIQDYSACISSISQAVSDMAVDKPGTYVINNSTNFDQKSKIYNHANSYSPSSAFGESANGYGSMPHKENGNKTPQEKLDEVTPEVNSAHDNYKTAKTTAEKLEAIGEGCEEFFTEDSTTYQINPSANFHYLQIFLNGHNEKEGPEFIVNYGACSANLVKTKLESKGSGVYGNNEAAETLGFRDVKTPPDIQKTMREIEANLDGLMDSNKRMIKRKVIEDKYWDGGCDIPIPSGEAQMTLYPGPQVIGYYEEEGAIHFDPDADTSGNRHLLTAHEYQYAVYLTTYEASYETWWDMHGLGLDSKSREKFTSEFNTGTTCSENSLYRVTSKGTARDLKDTPSIVPFTCTLNIQLGGVRIGTCGGGTSGTALCSDPAGINEVYEFKVVDPRNPFPQDNIYKANPKMAINWKKNDGSWGKTYNKITSVAAADKTYAPENLTYSYKLTTTAMNKIKEYNVHNSYNSFDEKTTCTCNEDLDKSGCGEIKDEIDNPSACVTGNEYTYICKKCKSDFLSNSVSSYWNNSSANLESVRSSIWG